MCDTLMWGWEQNSVLPKSSKYSFIFFSPIILLLASLRSSLIAPRSKEAHFKGPRHHLLSSGNFEDSLNSLQSLRLSRFILLVFACD